jgi:DNA-binding GntR family transcriptional regulator
MDPEDPRPTYIRIADKLREGFEPGGQLPSAPKIAEEWGVAKETVRAAIDVLRKEGLIVSWQGRGTFYRAQPEAANDETVTSAALLSRMDELMNRLEDMESRLSALEHSPTPEAGG